MRYLSIIISIIAIVFLSSCSKKNENPACDSLLTKLSTHLVHNTLTTDVTTEFYYDNSSQLIRIVKTLGSNITTDSIYYTNGAITKIRETSVGGNDYVQDNIWTNTNGRVTSIASYAVSNPSETVGENLFYDAAGRLDSLNILVHGNLDGTGQRWTYDDSGNLQTYYAYYDPNYPRSGVACNGNDDQKNPYSLLAVAMHQPQFSSADGTIDNLFLSVHNPTIMKTISDNPTTTSYAYVYNSDGYPTLVTRTNDSGNDVQTFSYEYSSTCK